MDQRGRGRTYLFANFVSPPSNHRVGNGRNKQTAEIPKVGRSGGRMPYQDTDSFEKLAPIQVSKVVEFRGPPRPG
jgi:hypothetical protein